MVLWSNTFFRNENISGRQHLGYAISTASADMQKGLFESTELRNAEKAENDVFDIENVILDVENAVFDIENADNAVFGVENDVFDFDWEEYHQFGGFN